MHKQRGEMEGEGEGKGRWTVKDSLRYSINDIIMLDRNLQRTCFRYKFRPNRHSSCNLKPKELFTLANSGVPYSRNTEAQVEAGCKCRLWSFRPLLHMPGLTTERPQRRWNMTVSWPNSRLADYNKSNQSYHDVPVSLQRQIGHYLGYWCQELMK